ncbi:STAS domain-containing protein [Streptomyces sp. NPDC089799]|uniref:STAS domain-containing protein n=1 Tax=Streptomyces sp. NPDC089799 TaxID=3155066 RepID=UPI003433E048
MTSRPERQPGRTDDAIAVVIEEGPGRTVARVSGEIDMDAAAGLREDLGAALASSRDGLDLDLAAVTFCDSSGLHVLLDLNRMALEAGKSLALTALSRPVARLLRITGARQVLTAHDRPASEARHDDGGPAPRDGPHHLDFEMETRRYGPTVHLTPVGELDMDTGPALDEVLDAVDGVDVVACDMRHLTFLDVVGLRRLLDFVRSLDARGIAFFAYNWRHQPRRFLDLVDELSPPARNGGRPTRMLRRLQDFAAAARAAGAARARQDAPRRRPAFPPRQDA